MQTVVLWVVAANELIVLIEKKKDKMTMTLDIISNVQPTYAQSVDSMDVPTNGS